MCNFVSEIFPSIHWCPFPNGMQLGSFQRSITFPYWRHQPKDFHRLSFSLQRRLIGSRLVSWTWESLFLLFPSVSATGRHENCFKETNCSHLISIGIHWPSCCGRRAEELLSEGGFISHLLMSVCEVRFSCLPQRLYTSRISCWRMSGISRLIRLMRAPCLFVCVCVKLADQHKANIRYSNPWIPWQSDDYMHTIWREKCSTGTAIKASFCIFSVCDGCAGCDWYLVPSMQAVDGSVRHLVWMISTEVSRLPFVLASSGSAVFK